MKRVLTIAVMCIILVMGSLVYSAVSNLNFAWQQDAASLSTIKSWKIYKSETAGTGYTLFYEILYNGTPQQEYTGATTLDQPIGTKKTYYFVCRALGTNGVESGNSNEVSATIDWNQPSVPIMFKVTVTN